MRQAAGQEELPSPSPNPTPVSPPYVPEPIPQATIHALPMPSESPASEYSTAEQAIESDLDLEYPLPDSAEFMQGSYGNIPRRGDIACNEPMLGFYWVKAEYLLWSMEGAPAPALVSTSAAGTSRANAGVLGLPTTRVLFGNDQILDEGASGLRLELGVKLDQMGINAIAINYYGLDQVSDGFSASGSTFPILARPFVNVEPGNVGPNAELVAFPSALTGNINVSANSEFHGGDVLLHHALENNGSRRLKVLLGYRHNALDDDLTIRDFKEVTDGSSGLAVGTTLAEFDRFQTKNRFHGASLGFMAEGRYQRWTMDVLMKLGLGQTNAEASLSGQTISTVPLAGGGTDVAITPDGLLVQGTNAGNYDAQEFAMIPELGVVLGCNLTRRLKATVGYNFIYWSRVARASEQIDPLVNLSQLGPAGLDGLARPEFAWTWNDFIAQGLSAGLDFRY